MTGLARAVLAPCLLVVDDEAVPRLLVARAAERLGYRAEAIASLPEAVALLRTHEPDVLVLDLSLREHDGIELLREVARLGRDPAIILVSGFDARVRDAAARLTAALGLRIAGTLGKPLHAEQVLAAIAGAPARPPGRAPLPRPTPAMLDAAIANGEIQCLFQPKARLDTGRVAGFEALARWHSAALGTVGPDAFIPLAERHGLIDRITLHMLDRALEQARTWSTLAPEIGVAVNLSPISLGDPELPARIAAALDRHGIAPGRLTLEVTEGAVTADYVAAADILTRLRIRGVRIAIDDFGTGHAALIPLLRLPLDEVKLDRQFVRSLLTDTGAPRIARAVVSLAAAMGLEVVAEGVETEAACARLRALGVRIGQGYLFAPALGAEAATALLAEQAQPEIAAP